VPDEELKQDAQASLHDVVRHHLELDLGFDSMERVEMMASLEQRLGLQLPEHFGAEVYTLRDLIVRLEEQAGAGAAEAEPEEAPEQPRETPYERTQRILEELRQKRSGEAVEGPAVASGEPEPSAVVSTQEGEPQGKEAEQEEPSRPKTATAFDRTQEILQDLIKKRKSEAEPAAAVETVTSVAEAQVTSVDPAEFERLSAQVTQLRDEMAALRQELQALRAAAVQIDETADGLPVEEAA